MPFWLAYYSGDLDDQRTLRVDKMTFNNEEDGSNRGLTAEGEKTVRILKLNDPIFCNHRRRAFIVLEMKMENPDNPAVHQLFMQVFGYPDDLPDLRRLRPPEGNTISGSEEICYYALRERGELGEVY